MSGKERMSRHAHSRSQIARSLREDGMRHIGNDLNLWPQIRARINDAQQEEGRVRGSVSARVEHEETLARWGGRAQGTWRERNSQLNLTRMLPSALMAVCMVAFVLTSYLLSNNSTVPSNTTVDACELITQAEVESITGTSMEQFRWQPNKEELVACAYFGESEMMDVMVANFSNQEEAEKYLASIRPDLVSNMETEQALAGYGVGTSIGGRRLDISGDEGYSTVRTPSNRHISFWDVLVKQHNRYFIITWMTKSERPDPTVQLEDLARLVAARLSSR